MVLAALGPGSARCDFGAEPGPRATSQGLAGRASGLLNILAKVTAVGESCPGPTKAQIRANDLKSPKITMQRPWAGPSASGATKGRSSGAFEL